MYHPQTELMRTSCQAIVDLLLFVPSQATGGANLVRSVDMTISSVLQLAFYRISGNRFCLCVPTPGQALPGIPSHFYIGKLLEAQTEANSPGAREYWLADEFLE